MKEGVVNRLLHITAPAALWRNGQLRCKQFLANSEGIPDDQPDKRSLVVIEAPNPGGPRLQQVTLLRRHTKLADKIASLTKNDIMPYSTTAGCQRDLSAAKRELLVHADTHDRRGTCFWENGGSPCSAECPLLSNGKDRFASSFQKLSVAVSCEHIRSRKVRRKVWRRVYTLSKPRPPSDG